MTGNTSCLPVIRVVLYWLNTSSHSCRRRIACRTTRWCSILWWPVIWEKKSPQNTELLQKRHWPDLSLSVKRWQNTKLRMRNSMYSDMRKAMALWSSRSCVTRMLRRHVWCWQRRHATTRQRARLWWMFCMICMRSWASMRKARHR